jgi:RHS repeat-associated protein
LASGVVTGTAQTRYIHPDHLDSTNVATDQNDNLVQTLDYFPYGATRVSVSTSTNEKRKYIDQFSDDSGLSYLNARYYNPTQGQFISQDNVFWEIGLTSDGKRALANPQYANAYAYSSDNPITNKDPSGRIAGIDDAISFGVGGLINTGIYTAGSLATGQQPTWGGAAGAFVTGGILGWAVDNAPETGGGSVAATLAAMKYAAKWGAIAAPAGNAATQGINIANGSQSGINWMQLGISPVQGATSAALGEGLFPEANIPFLSYGRGSFNAVRKTMFTKYSNGTIQNMSASTAFKGAIGSQAASTYKTVGGAVWDAGSSAVANASVTSMSTWMGSFNPFLPHK